MIPYAQIDTVFLDVGNTLISIDFDWVAAELMARRFDCAPEALRRAEAAARPAFSRRLLASHRASPDAHPSAARLGRASQVVEPIPEGLDLFRAYLLAMIERVEAAARWSRGDLDALVTELRPVLRPDGRASVLWRSVMPRVRDALATLHDAGVTLVVVSNSDGTCEEGLVAAELRPYLSVVVDSAIAGFEKPDPRIFAHALAACGARPERTLHVGDLYHADVEGARGAGLHAVLLDPFDDWSDVECERLPDVWAVAERLAAARRGSRLEAGS